MGIWGGLMGLSSIPILGFQFFFILGLLGFFFCAEQKTFQHHASFAMGCLGFGYFLIALHWIPCALHVNWAQYFYLLPFALLGLPLLFGFYYALWSWCLPWYRFQGFLKIFLFIVMWVTLEIIRAELFTGFPWALLGTMWAPILPIAQLVAWIGPYGLSGLTLAWGLTFYICLSPTYHRWKKILYTTVMLLSLGGSWFYGVGRLSSVPTTPSSFRLRLVQPNLSQKGTWNKARLHQTLHELISLSTSTKSKIVLWPESALPLAPQLYPGMIALIRQAIPKGGVLLTNGLFYTAASQNSRGFNVHNAVLAINDQGDLLGLYAKHRLLPFGEYIPFRMIVDKIFPGLIHKMSGGIGDFSKGPGPQVLAVPCGPPVLPMVCHEAIFSGAFHASHTREAQWILSLTNDGWFLNSLGPYQHFEMARMRAIEMGLPLIRVANTGISAVVDPLGRVEAKIPYGVRDAVDVTLPQFLKEPPFYRRMVEKDFYSFLVMIMGGFVILRIFLFLLRKRKS